MANTNKNKIPQRKVFMLVSPVVLLVQTIAGRFGCLLAATRNALLRERRPATRYKNGYKERIAVDRQSGKRREINWME